MYFSLGMVDKYRRLAERDDVILSAFFTIDAPIVQPRMFRKLPDMAKHFKRLYSYTSAEAVRRFGCGGVTLSKLHIPYCYDAVFEDLWAREDRAFLCILNYNRLCRRTWNEL